MTKPKTKEQLIEQTTEKYQKLEQLLASFTPEEQQGIFPFADRDKNLRDVLAHVYEWENMMKDWYTIGMSGGTPIIPREGYTWDKLKELNLKILERYQQTSFEDARALLAANHQWILKTIEQHTQDELFIDSYYPWTSPDSLATYFISTAPEHYDWALEKIQRYKEAL